MTIIYIVLFALIAGSMVWLYNRNITNKHQLIFTALICGVGMTVLAYFEFFIYCMVFLGAALLSRSTATGVDNSKFANYILGFYFGVWLSVPMGAYQLAI